MAPIPTTLSEEAGDLVSSLQRRQRDLTKVQIPRLRSCEGPLSLQQNYAGELRDDCDSFERDLEALDLCVDDQRGEKNRAALRALVEDYRSQLASIRQDARAALLASKRAIDSQSRSKREELLTSTAKNEKQDPNGSEKVGEDLLMKTNNDVTEALRRTIALMQGELERSVLTTQMLENSTATLQSTSNTHDTLTNVMDVSKQLITALEKADWLDRLLILSAFVFFLLVILLILKQRILDRSLRIAFWWTRFIPFGSSSSSVKEKVVPTVTSLSASSTVLAVSSSLGSLASSVTAAATASVTSSITASSSASVTEVSAAENTDISSTLTSVLPSDSELPVSSVAEPTPSPLPHEDEL